MRGFELSWNGRSLLPVLAALFLGPEAHSQACTFLFEPRDDTGTVWFQGTGPVLPLAGLPPHRSAGVAELASSFFQTAVPPSLPVYQGASFSWTPEHVFLTLVGGGVATVEVLDPAGMPITDTLGIAVLASAFRETFDTGTGLTTGVVVEGAAYVYTQSRVLLVLVGGGLSTLEVTDPVGAPIPGTRGVGVLDGAVFNVDPDPCEVDSLVEGAAILYTGSRAYLSLLNLAGPGLAIVELLASALPIAGTRGVAPMASSLPPPGFGPFEAAAYLWTAGRVFLVTVGGGTSVTEVTDPSGASIAGTWGVVRLDAGFFGAAGVYQGVAEIVTPEKLHLSLVGGGIASVEVLDPAGGSIETHVRFVAERRQRQAGLLLESTGRMDPPGEPRQAGSIVGVTQRVPSPGT